MHSNELPLHPFPQDRNPTFHHAFAVHPEQLVPVFVDLEKVANVLRGLHADYAFERAELELGGECGEGHDCRLCDAKFWSVDEVASARTGGILNESLVTLGRRFLYTFRTRGSSLHWRGGRELIARYSKACRNRTKLAALFGGRKPTNRFLVSLFRCLARNSTMKREILPRSLDVSVVDKEENTSLRERWLGGIERVGLAVWRECF